MQVTKAGESRRFQLPFKVDRRVAIVVALALVAGMAGHLIVQAFSPGKAGAAQSRPSVLAIDSQPAIYLAPSARAAARVVDSSLKPDIDIQPHAVRKRRERRHDAERSHAEESASTEKADKPKEEETQSTERIDSEEGTTFVPKRHTDEEPPKEPPVYNFNGLDG